LNWRQKHKLLRAYFQLFALALVIKAFFLFSQQELPAVALLLPEKIAFIASGLPLHSGAGQLSNLKQQAFSNHSSTIFHNANHALLSILY
jgi:hypothetical protein